MMKSFLSFLYLLFLPVLSNARVQSHELLNDGSFINRSLKLSNPFCPQSVEDKEFYIKLSDSNQYIKLLENGNLDLVEFPETDLERDYLKWTLKDGSLQNLNSQALRFGTSDAVMDIRPSTLDCRYHVYNSKANAYLIHRPKKNFVSWNFRTDLNTEGFEIVFQGDKEQRNLGQFVRNVKFAGKLASRFFE